MRAVLFREAVSRALSDYVTRARWLESLEDLERDSRRLADA